GYFPSSRTSLGSPPGTNGTTSFTRFAAVTQASCVTFATLRSPRRVVEWPYPVELCGFRGTRGTAPPMPTERSNGGASPDEPPPSKQLQDLEEELCRLGGVLAVRVVGDRSGRPVEVHVLSDHTKPAKQTVRDVRAVAQTVFGLEIDHRIVSVAQFGDDNE